MKKLLLGLGICLILGVLLYFAVQNWVRTETLKAIESATGAKVQMQAFRTELLAGRVRLLNAILVPKEPSTPVEKITVENASGQILWSEWNAGVVPMAVTLEGCEIILGNRNEIRFLKKHIGRTHLTTAGGTSVPDHSTEPPKSGIVLTAVTAKNVKILGSKKEPTFASKVNCSARRGLNGWEGQLSAESLGSGTLPLTNVQIGFSAETEGTRVAEFRCNLIEGTLSGNGWCSKNGLAVLDLRVDSLQLASVAPAWLCNSISGIVSGSFTYTGQTVQWQLGTIAGDFDLKEGMVKFGAASRILSIFEGRNESATFRLDAASAALNLSPEQWTLFHIHIKKVDLFEMRGQLSCSQDAKLKGDMQLGIASQIPTLLAHPTAMNGTEQGGTLTWIPLQFETTPDQLWSQILANISRPVPTPTTLPADSKPALQEKAKAAVDTVINIFSR